MIKLGYEAKLSIYTVLQFILTSSWPFIGAWGYIAAFVVLGIGLCMATTFRIEDGKLEVDPDFNTMAHLFWLGTAAAMLGAVFSLALAMALGVLK